MADTNSSSSTLEATLASSSSKQLITKDELRQLIYKAGVVNITFTKSDGTERVLKATLHPEVVVPYEKKTARVKKDNPDVMAVWDMEAGSWRSVNVNRITCLYYTEENE